jgi:predicted ATPase/Tfp pilus assembly protein PilF
VTTRAGELLDGRFRIETQAGEGAMGTVLRALDLTTDEPVAVKIMRLDRAHNERFAREAEALARVRSAGVVRYVHHGLDRDGSPYLAMAWIDGPSLDQRLDKGALQALDALRLGEQLARALHEVHAARIVHRDLKPSNIMLEHGALLEARIMDFGIAKLGGERTAITNASGQLGTPRYMAPEQIRDPAAVDGRADIFALGCVLFECLTGVPAFGAEDPIAVIAQILFQPAPEPSALCPGLPDAIDRLFETLLAREPSARPSALELAQALERLSQAPLERALASVPVPVARALSVPMDAARRPPTAGASEPPLRLSSERKSAPELESSRADGVHGALIGRERELALAQVQLAGGLPVALWGSAGVGKTRLALELLRIAPERWTRLFVDLSFATSTEDAVRSVAEHAGLTLPPTERPELVMSALLGKLGRVLLVLDRVESLAGSIEPLLRLFRDHGPRMQLIVTSRLRLRLPSALELLGLSSERVGAARLSDAATLLHARAGRALPGLPMLERLSSESVAVLERVAAALEGNPLAIELAAARAAVLGLDGLLERVSRPMTMLAELPGDPIRDALEGSFDELDPHTYGVLLQCAQFRGGFELRAAEAVVQRAPDAPPLADLLQRLRERSLLSARASGGDGRARLSLPSTVRELALERCAARVPHDPVLAGAAARHMRCFAGLATELLRQPEQRARFVPEHHNALAALRCSLHGSTLDLPAAFALLRALEPVLLAQGPAGELASLLDQALELAGDSSQPELYAAQLSARQLRARLLAPAGELERAFAELSQVIDGARALGARQLEASAQLDLGVAHHFARDLVRAGEHYTRALALLEQDGDIVSEARCVGNLAAIAHDRGALQPALADYRRAIALLEDTSEPRLLANFWGNRALCEHELEHTVLAAESYQRALALLEPLGDARLLGIVLSNYGTLVLEQDGPAAALPLQQRACALLQGAGDPRSDALARGRRAVVHAQLDQSDEAERDCAYAERALRRDPIGVATIALFRGFLELAHARRAHDAGARAVAEAERAAAAHRLELARSIGPEGRRLLDQCDDLRLYARLLESALTVQ